MGSAGWSGGSGESTRLSDRRGVASDGDYWGRSCSSGARNASSKDSNGVWSGGGSDWSSPKSFGSGGSCRIKVCNVPRNLDWRDIKEAFEDNGRVARCDVDRGVAWVTFETPRNAKKAVQTFDRGELNGQMIFVSHE